MEALGPSVVIAGAALTMAVLWKLVGGLRRIRRTDTSVRTKFRR